MIVPIQLRYRVVVVDPKTGKPKEVVRKKWVLVKTRPKAS